MTVIRFLRGLRRPSKATNSRLLRERGENATTSFVIRDAMAADIPALARLHVTAWNATYPGFRLPPTYELRERQWREAFAMIEGIRDSAISAGLIQPESFDAGVQDLYRTTEADGVFCYTFFKGVGEKRRDV